MKNILIAVDYGPAATLVVQKGKELADSTEAAVTLVHVITDAAYYSSLNYSPITGFDSFSSLDILQTGTVDEVRSAAKDYLTRIVENFAIKNAVCEVREGDFADEILEVGKEKSADVIVLGTHSRKGFEKIFMGSVTEKVLHKSEIPLLIIPIRNR